MAKLLANFVSIAAARRGLIHLALLEGKISKIVNRCCTNPFDNIIDLLGVSIGIKFWLYFPERFVQHRSHETNRVAGSVRVWLLRVFSFRVTFHEVFRHARRNVLLIAGVRSAETGSQGRPHTAARRYLFVLILAFG